jgi:hypothetical protein
MKTHHLKPIHDLNTPTQSRTKRNARVYRLQTAPAAPSSAPFCATVDPLTAARAPWPAPQPLHPTQFPTPPPGKSVIKVGLDIDLQRLTSTIQWDHLQPKPARDLRRKLLGRNWIGAGAIRRHVSTALVPNRWRARLRALRALRGSMLKKGKTWRKFHNPLDSLHRRCRACYHFLLGNTSGIPRRRIARSRFCPA